MTTLNSSWGKKFIILFENTFWRNNFDIRGMLTNVSRDFYKSRETFFFNFFNSFRGLRVVVIDFSPTGWCRGCRILTDSHSTLKHSGQTQFYFRILSASFTIAWPKLDQSMRTIRPTSTASRIQLISKYESEQFRCRFTILPNHTKNGYLHFYKNNRKYC